MYKTGKIIEMKEYRDCHDMPISVRGIDGFLDQSSSQGINQN